jgi:hypothetical protein
MALPVVSLRLQAIHDPGVTVSRVNDSVVHSIRATLPKLDSRWNDPVPTPVRRSWNIAVSRESFLCVVKLLLNRSARLDWLGLFARPRGHLGTTRSSCEVFARFIRRDFVRLAFDDHLSVHCVPPENGSDGGFTVERVSFAREVVRSELETVVESFEEDGSRRGTSVIVDGSQHHRIGFVNSELLGVLQPRRKLFERVRDHFRLFKGVRAVILVP